MFGGERRKTGGMSLTGRASLAITPTKRFTDFGISSSRKTTNPRPSLNIGPRQSLFGSKSASVAPRDVKSIQQGNVQKIYRFFVETDGDDAPPESIIRAPGGKADFITIFEQIYQHLSKDYEFPQGARLEDEIAQIFKGLGYPFPLKKSFFQPMGCAHGWPHLLDALGWLVDLVRISIRVSSDTQNILFGDFMEESKLTSKFLNYAWHTKVYKDYTNDRKVIDNPHSQFWLEAKSQLRDHFETANEYDDWMDTAKNNLEQLKFDCDEIESERGQEQHLLDEIAKMKDDIRKADDYLQQTANLKVHKETALQEVQQTLLEKQGELEKIQKVVNELKERIEQQKVKHGLSGKEVRQMNLENQKDKETVSEIQGVLDQLSKEAWSLKNDDSFKEQKAKFVQLAEHITKIMSGLDIEINLARLSVPSDERQLKANWETLTNVWMPEVNRQLHQKKLDLETEISRFTDKFAAAEERNKIESEMLCEAKKKDAREERLYLNERKEWQEARQQLQKRCDELENEKEVLKKEMKMDGSLEKEIEEEKTKMAKEVKELRAKQTELEAVLRQKLDQIVAEVTDIQNEKLMVYKEFNDLGMIFESKLPNY